MDFITNFVKQQGKWFVISGILGVLLLLAVGYWYINSLEENIKFFHAEHSMAQAYSPDTRRALFKLVVDEEQYEYLGALTEELDNTLEIMSNRLSFRYFDMSDTWREWFIPGDSDKLSNKALHSQGLRSYTKYFSYLSQFESLTAAEKEYMQLVRAIWNKYDSLIKDQKLDVVYLSYYSGASGGQGYYGKDNEPYFSLPNIEGAYPDADILADHFYNFVKELYQLPRTVNNFFYDIRAISAIDIKGATIPAKITVDSKQTVQKLTDIMRNYNYYNNDSAVLNDLRYDYQIQFIRNKGSVNIKFYDEYIEVSGVLDDFDTIKDYVQTRYSFIPLVNGVYQVDSKLLIEIKNFVDSLKGS